MRSISTATTSSSAQESDLHVHHWCLGWFGEGFLNKTRRSEASIKFSIVSGARHRALEKLAFWHHKQKGYLNIGISSSDSRTATAWAEEANHTRGLQSILGPCTCQHNPLPWTDLWASKAATLSQQPMVVPGCQPVLLLQAPVRLPLSALLYNLLYVLEQLHSTPQNLHLLIAAPGSAVSLFSPVLGKFRSWHLSWGVAHSSWLTITWLPIPVRCQPVFLAMASSGLTLVKARSRTEPCSSVNLANSPKPGLNGPKRERLGNLRGGKSFSSFEPGGSGTLSMGYCRNLTKDVGGGSPLPNFFLK